MPRPPTPSHGTLARWDDDRGFGFIRPDSGGPELFVHATAFARTSVRPQVGDALTFGTGPGRDGRPAAVNVRSTRATTPGPSLARQRLGTSARRAPHSRRAWWSIPALVAVGVSISALWSLPVWLVWWYVALSFVCAAAYAVDKAAAVRGRWRTKERTLLLLGLLGGWPGAVVAQQLLRHKTSKVSFRQSFWATVVVNVVVLVLLRSPAAAGLLDSLTTALPSI